MKIAQLAVLALIVFVSFSCDYNQKDDKAVHASIDLTCYFFFIPDCPASINNMDKVSELDKEYGDNVKFIGVLSEPLFPNEKTDSVIELYKINIEVLIDDSLDIARKHGATVTPEFFLYTSDDKLLYSGAMDDYYFSIGRHRNKVKKKYLEDAINSALKGNPIKIRTAQPFGCRIELDYFNKVQTGIYR